MAIPIGLILGGAQLLGGGIKSLIANKQAKKARDYQPPAEDRAALALAQMEAANPDMPGQQAIEDNISLASANALAGARESGSLSENVVSIAAEENKAKRDLGIAAAQDQKRDITNLRGQLGQMGQKRDTQFQVNTFAPYAQNYQEGRQLVGAGIENLSMGFQEKNILDQIDTGEAQSPYMGGNADPNIGLGSDTRNLGGGIGFNSDNTNLIGMLLSQLGKKSFHN